MKYLYNSLEPITVSGAKLLVEAKTDGNTLSCTVVSVNDSSPTVSGTVTYRGTTLSFYLAGGRTQSLLFDYSENVKTLTLSSGGVQKTCTWRSSFADPAPTVSIGYTGIRINSDILTTFDYSEVEDHIALVAAKLYCKHRSDGWTLMDYTVSKITADSYSKHIFAGNPPGTLYRYVLLFALYENASDALGEYIGLTEYELPVFTLTDEGTPFSPCGLNYEGTYSGMPVEVSWNAVNDPEFTVDGYIVKRSVNGSAETEVYRGTVPHFTDTAPASAHEVKYCVCSVSGEIFSHYAEGDAADLITSNILVGAGGVRQAARLYIGKGGEITETSAVAVVG